MFTVNDATGSPKVEIQGDIQVVDQPESDKTGLMLIGPTERGPAFSPSEIRNVRELSQKFGDGETYITYAARKALEETDSIQLLRVMHEKGWVDENAIVLHADVSNDVPIEISNQNGQINKDSVILSVITLSDSFRENVDINKTVISSTATLENFKIEFFDENNNSLQKYKLSYDTFSKKYIENVFDDDENVNIFVNFNETHKNLFSLNSEYEVNINFNYQNSPISFDQKYKYSRTPWIVSQTIAGGDRFPLFRFVARGAGNSENRRFKVSINEIGDFREKSDYGFFTVQIRDFNDNDFNKNVLESFEDVTLDPNHERYIKKVIGDKWREFQENKIIDRGQYENQSEYVRVVVHEDVRKAGKKALPYGFESYLPSVSFDFLNNNSDLFLQPVSYRNSQDIGLISEYIEVSRPESGGSDFNERIHLGFDFRDKENESYLNSIGDGFEECFFNDELSRDSDFYKNNCLSIKNFVENQIGDKGFHLEDAGDMNNDYKPDDISKRKFSVGLQGGFDGANPDREKFKDQNIESSNVFGFDLSSTSNQDYLSYRKALNLINEVSIGFNYNLLSIPGVDMEKHFNILSEAEEMVRRRGDVFLITDIKSFGSDVDTAISSREIVDSSYMAAYFGWADVSNIDQYHDFVPASSFVPSVYIRNDNVNDPWFAPAGYNRGVVEDVKDVNFRLTENEQDLLYNNEINFVDFFSPSQVIVWGQKTLTDANSVLNRVNVRRLLVTLKSRIQKISERYLFEQQNNRTIRNFERDIREFLAEVRSNQGIFNFDVSLNFKGDQVNSDNINDPNTIEGRVGVIPIEANEFIFIDFTINETRITF